MPLGSAQSPLYLHCQSATRTGNIGMGLLCQIVEPRTGFRTRRISRQTQQLMRSTGCAEAPHADSAAHDANSMLVHGPVRLVPPCRVLVLGQLGLKQCVSGRETAVLRWAVSVRWRRDTSPAECRTVESSCQWSKVLI